MYVKKRIWSQELPTNILLARNEFTLVKQNCCFQRTQGYLISCFVISETTQFNPLAFDSLASGYERVARVWKLRSNVYKSLFHFQAIANWYHHKERSTTFTYCRSLTWWSETLQFFPAKLALLRNKKPTFVQPCDSAPGTLCPPCHHSPRPCIQCCS